MHGRQLPCLQGRNLICTALCIQIPHSASPTAGVGAVEVDPPHLFAIHAVFGMLVSHPCLQLTQAKATHGRPLMHYALRITIHLNHLDVWTGRTSVQ